MACVKTSALQLVFSIHRGWLQSYEYDQITRCMAADRIVRRLKARIRSIVDCAASVGSVNENTEINATIVATSLTVQRLNALIPDYIVHIPPTEPLYMHDQWLMYLFEHAIYDRTRANIWQRMGLADALRRDFEREIEGHFPFGHAPTSYARLTFHRERVGDGWLDYNERRSVLVTKLQHLIPELCLQPLDAPTFESNGSTLGHILAELRRRSGDVGSHNRSIESDIQEEEQLHSEMRGEIDVGYSRSF